MPIPQWLDPLNVRSVIVVAMAIAQAQPGRTIAFTHVAVVDGRSPSPALDQTGVITGNRIQNVVGIGGILDASSSATILTGLYVRQSRLTTVSANEVFNFNYTDTANFNRAYAIQSEAPAFSTVGTPSQNSFVNNY